MDIFIYRDNIQNLLKFVQNIHGSFRENRHFMLWGLFERPLLLELECSFSLGTDLWWTNS